MTEYWRFFRRHPALLGFGLSFSFFSSFGQTFLISLFVPFVLIEFALTNAEFGSLYSAATLGSALLLPWAGQWLDRVSLNRFAAGVVILMASAALLMATAWNVAAFGVALLGVRFAGQGLSSHTAMTTMARYFEGARGKALSISSLGFPFGEAVLPLLVAGSISLLGWRWSWGAVVLIALVGFGPLLLLLLHRSGVETDPRKAGEGGQRGAAPPSGTTASGSAASGTTADGPAAGVPATPPAPDGWNRREVIRDARIWFILPAALLPPFWTTGLFLYQTAIAGAKGWSLALMASGFTAFAITRIIFSLGAGGLIDRFSARHVLPFTPLPLGAGMALLLFFEGVWVVYAFMACVGVTLGFSGTVKPALWAELYGIRHLGAIKSMMGSLMVVSTAGSPILVGFVLDLEGGLDGLLMGGVISILIGAVLAFRIFPRKAETDSR